MSSSDLYAYWFLPVLAGLFGGWGLINYLRDRKAGGWAMPVTVIVVASIWGLGPIVLGLFAGGAYPRGYIPPDYVGICAKQVEKLVGYQSIAMRQIWAAYISTLTY